VNNAHPDPLWPDVYQHCHKCEQIKAKDSMVKVAEHFLCVDCASCEIKCLKDEMKILANTKNYELNDENVRLRKVLEQLQQSLVEREKFAADLKNRVEYLERTIRLAYCAIQ
jgi:putative hemolysin